MSKYITEKSLKNIQIRYAVTERLELRRVLIELACKIMYMFNAYSLYQNAAAANDDVTIEEWEEILPLFNRLMGTEYNLSNFFEDPDQKADVAIIYYKSYKELLIVFEGRLFKASVAEKLFTEIYKSFEDAPANIFTYEYYSKIAKLILEYMCERIDYNTFMKNVLEVKIVPNQKPLDSTMLKKMISTGMELVARYMKIFKEEKAKGNI